MAERSCYECTVLAEELTNLRAELEEAKRLHEHVNDLLANEIELGCRTAEELGREREARKRAEADLHHACDRADRAEACALSVEVLEQLADMCEHASVHCVDDDDSAVATELLVNVKASLSAARSGEARAVPDCGPELALAQAVPDRAAIVVPGHGPELASGNCRSK